MQSSSSSWLYCNFTLWHFQLLSDGVLNWKVTHPGLLKVIQWLDFSIGPTTWWNKFNSSVDPWGLQILLSEISLSCEWIEDILTFLSLRHRSSSSESTSYSPPHGLHSASDFRSRSEDPQNCYSPSKAKAEANGRFLKKKLVSTRSCGSVSPPACSRSPCCYCASDSDSGNGNWQ